jgi:hypothetical protein
MLPISHASSTIRKRRRAPAHVAVLLLSVLAMAAWDNSGTAASGFQTTPPTATTAPTPTARETLQGMIVGQARSMMVSVAAKLRIADHLGMDRNRSRCWQPRQEPTKTRCIAY